MSDTSDKSRVPVPNRARVVVIGGGAVGASILWYLTQAGWRDCVLLEKGELTSGSTWHAAGNCPTFSTDWAVMRIQACSAELYRTLGARVGYPINYHVTGSVRLAHDARRMAEFAMVRSMGRRCGLPLELLDPDEVVARHPFAERHDIAGGLWDPLDGDIDPSQLTQAFAKGARDAGAHVARFCPATGLRRAGDRWVVEHARGETACDVVVNAAGYYAGRVGEMFAPHGGRPVPMAVMSHQYMLTEEIAAVADWTAAQGRKLPVLRDVDTSYYLRQEKSGFNLGPYERDCRAHWTRPEEMPEDFGFQLFPDDLDRLEVQMTDAMERVPELGRAGIARVINGPIPYAPDGLPLLGPMPGVRGAFEACAFTFGIAQAGGAGRVMADWITRGRPGWDCRSVDPRRFGEEADPQACIDRAMETYGHEFAMHFPRHAWPAGRDRLLSPIHGTLLADGARMSAYGGWERADWFARPGDDVSEAATRTWSRQGPWQARVAEEVAAVSGGAGVLDLCGFARFGVDGPGAEAWLDGLVAGGLPPPGRVALAYVLNDGGGVKAEFSLRRAGDGFELISAAAARSFDRDLLRHRLPADGSVTVRDRTKEVSTLLLTGPASRDVLADLTDGDLALPWLSCHQARVAGRAAELLRVSFAGELGWEIHAAPADVPAIHAIHAALREAGAAPFGMYALDSMRIEKGYPAWGAELSSDYTPAALGLGRFTGGDGSAPSRRLVSLVVEGSEADAPPGAPVRRGDRIVGEVTSAAWGHRVGAALALAVVEAEAAVPGTALEVEVYGQVCAAILQPSTCLWDPGNDRMRSQGVAVPSREWSLA